jgi:hypothetical protein
MVFDHIDKEGMWWKGSKDHTMYVFYWNPLKAIVGWLQHGLFFGFLPFKSTHIR